MIYIIDDKRSRQRDYGWDEERFMLFADIVIVIWDIESLIKYRSQILEPGNIILFHESFSISEKDDSNKMINSFKSELELRKEAMTSYIAYFSGSKNSRYVENNSCSLPPDVLYSNLEVFIKKAQNSIIDFKYLAFGENFQKEEYIRHKLDQINTTNVGGKRVYTERNIFFAVTSEDTIEPPFEDVETIEGWDFFDEDISDVELDKLVKQWFNDTKFDSIYIPLYFGNVYSDYMGLRLAMHIKLSNTQNQNTPVFIYGVSSYQDIRFNECFEVLKFSSVYIIGADNNSLIDSLSYYRNPHKDLKEIDRITLKVPNNIGDNHSVANQWAVYRWKDMLDFENEFSNTSVSEFICSLYYKYLSTKFGPHDKFTNKNKYNAKIDGIKGKTFIYIDDEYDKGWENILHEIFKLSEATFLCFKDFDKKLSRKELIDRIKEYLNFHDADCYLIDLRLHEDDFETNQRETLTGHEITRHIKKLNEGNQIVIFTASNKIWNLKEEIFKIGATGYTLKESPDLNLKRKESLSLYQDFSNSIKLACKMSYLKDLVKEQAKLKSILPTARQLDSIVNLLSKDNGHNDQDLLGAALLVEMVFIEDLIKNQLFFELISTGEGDSLRVELYKENKMLEIVTGHIFFKRIDNGSRTTVNDVSDYYENSIPVPSGWCNAIKSDVTLITAVLMIVYKIPRNLVKDYIDLKYIRNTQIAHAGKGNKKISVEQIINFYRNVICPIVNKS